MSGERTVVTVGASLRVGPGTRLNDLYEIEAVIAAGGMGEVFRGHAIETNDTVAIKVMRPEFAENVNALALFRKEASALHNVHTALWCATTCSQSTDASACPTSPWSTSLGNRWPSG